MLTFLPLDHAVSEMESEVERRRSVHVYDILDLVADASHRQVNDTFLPPLWRSVSVAANFCSQFNLAGRSCGLYALLCFIRDPVER